MAVTAIIIHMSTVMQLLMEVSDGGAEQDGGTGWFATGAVYVAALQTVLQLPGASASTGVKNKLQQNTSASLKPELKLNLKPNVNSSKMQEVKSRESWWWTHRDSVKEGRAERWRSQ